MTTYYNEFDPKAAAWLRELIADGLIAHGEVDERSIVETTNTGQLNPALSRWLMGFPVEWCIAAIRSTRKKPVP